MLQLPLSPYLRLGLFTLVFGFGFAVIQTHTVLAITTVPLRTVTPEVTETATESAVIATPSAELNSSASAQVEQKIQEKKDQDLTETGGKQKSKLAAYLDQHPIEPLSWHNPLQHSLRGAIDRGLPANIIVLLLLFPLVASVIAASRHVIGLTGFGIYIPAVLAVAFVSTGLVIGVVTFLAVLAAAMLAHKLVRRLRMPYLPRTAMLLWTVSVLILCGLIASAYLSMQFLISVSIFPLLIMMLLSENFMETQLFNSQKEAIRLMMETLFLAVACSVVVNLEPVQQFVLIRPELTLLGIAVMNLALGRYTGLRLLEYWRFQSIIEKQS